MGRVLTALEQRRRRTAAIGSVVLVAFLVLGAWLRRDLVSQALRQVHHLTWRGLGAIAALVVLHKVVQALLLRSSVEGLSLRDAFPISEVSAGCSNAFVGGSGIGVAAKSSMLRGRNIAGPAIAVSVVATAIGPSFAMWILALAHVVPHAMFGRADHLQLIVGAGATVFIAAPAMFWWMVLHRPAFLARGCAIGCRIQHALVHRMPAAMAQPIRSVDLHAAAGRARDTAAEMTRRRGVFVLVAAIASQLALAVLLLVVLRSLGPGAREVSDLEVLRAFALARVLGSFSPLPGGIGLLDVGLAGSLSSAGASRPTVMAGIAVYRACTFVLPMFTGLAAAAWWRATARSRVQVGDDASRLNLEVNPIRIAVGKHSSE
jgi:uncharacterized membrane protein YbhN (UPF0104 family)